MKRVINFLSAIIIFVFALLGSLNAHAQNTDSIKRAQKQRVDSLSFMRTYVQSKQYKDSVENARQAIVNKAKEAQKRTSDSLTAVRKQISDSISAARKHKADSLNFVRVYMQSKRYKDSVENVQQLRIAKMKEAQKRVTDSITNVRKREADSIMNVRRRYSDSIKNYNDSIRQDQVRRMEEQKEMRRKMADSLERIRVYKASNIYKDSVALARKNYKDSMAAARKKTNDSLRAAQKIITDSIVAERKAYNDSLKTALEEARSIRMRELDSLSVIRAARSDSLAKLREARAELRKQKAAEKEKAQKDKLNLNMELKIKKKQDAYTNEKMRKKSWSLPRKVIQNTFTRYNYYFNADKKMDEAIDNMLRSNTDNYDSLLSLFPFDPDRDSAKLMSDMDTIIRKASVGIQIHDPRAKWQDDLYLLVGQAYFYKADYQNAGAAFKHIVSQAEADKKEKEKKAGKPSKEDKNKPITFSEEEKTGLAGALEHKAAKNEAMLWLARVFTQSNKEGQAQTLIDMLRNDALFPERLKGRLALEQAFADLGRNDLNRAAQSLVIVAADKQMPDWLRLRANYLNGQLLQQQLHYAESDKHFKAVLGLNPNIDMDFYARKNLATNSINNGNNNGNAAQILEKMANDGKYRPYYDQIYYAMGKAALKNKQSDKALENFQKSVNLSQSNRKQKGLSFASLGDEYYLRSDYNKAKLSYDSAVQFLTIAQDPVYSIALQRAQALDRLAVPGNEVLVQDSLLALSALSEREQRAVIKDYIKSVERMMRDSAYRAANAGNNANMPVNQMGQQGSQAWYFANPNLMRKGENEFKQRWGNRQLKDNWRRSSASSNDFDVAADDAGADDELTNLPNEDSLFAAIPHTPEQIQKSKDILRESLFNLGKAYYTYLEDFPKAVSTFDTLDKRFPNHDHQAEVLYTRYLISMRQNQPNEATKYNTQLQSKYPDTEWAKLLKGSSALLSKGEELYAPPTTTAKETISNHYDETYGLLMQRQYASVLNRIKDADVEYKDQGNFKKKYDLMKAIAIAGTGSYPEADTMLSQFIATNPSDTLTNWANTVLNFIRANPLPVTNNNLNRRDSSQTQMTLSVDSSNLVYNYNAGQTHYVIISAQQDAKFSGLRSGLSDYNLMKAGNEGVIVTMSTLDAGRSLIICKEFASATAAKKYMNEIKNVKLLFREYQANEYDVLLISIDNFPKLFVKKDYVNYKNFYNKNYK